MWFLMFWLGFAYAVGALAACIGSFRGALGTVSTQGVDRRIAIGVGLLMMPVAVVIWPAVSLYTTLAGLFSKPAVAYVSSEGKVTWIN